MSPLIFFALQFAIIAYALVGGVFLAFSDFIMRSLANTGGVGGVDATTLQAGLPPLNPGWEYRTFRSTLGIDSTPVQAMRVEVSTTPQE